MVHADSCKVSSKSVMKNELDVTKKLAIEAGDILIAIGRTDSLTKLNHLARGMM